VNDEGERGRTGRAGEPGEAGAAGVAGAPGSAGAPGRQGDPGAPGRQGDPGYAGTAGGRGATGRPGRMLPVKAAVTGFLFTVAVFTFLALRSEANARNIRDNQRLIVDGQHATCAQLADLARELNGLGDALSRAEARRSSPDARLLADLAAVKTQVIACR